MGKKIAMFRKSAIDILKSKTVLQHSKFIISLKQNPSANNSNLTPNKLQFFKTIVQSSSTQNTLNINDCLQSANSLLHIDYIFCDIILHNSHNSLHE